MRLDVPGVCRVFLVDLVLGWLALGGSRLGRLAERGGAQSVTVKWISIAENR